MGQYIIGFGCRREEILQEMKEKKQKIADNHAGRKTVFLYPRFSDVESGRIRIHLGPWIRV